MAQSGYTNVIKKNYNPHLESLRDDINARRDKTFFWPTGTQVYVGRQGSGKTISAVKHLLDLKRRYPNAIVVSNIDLKSQTPIKFNNVERLKNAVAWLKTPDKGVIEPKLSTGNVKAATNYIQFDNMEQLTMALTNVNNGKLGVIYIIDEIHTYFNALESKNIPMYVFTEISQQRKQRKLIVGTSQLFLRMAKPFREQCDNLIVCNTLLGFLTFQRAYDGMTLQQDFDGSLKGDLKKMGFFFHTRKIRKSFDTFQKVVSGKEQYDQTQEMELTQKNKKIVVVRNT
jgi:hypothetical protein